MKIIFQTIICGIAAFIAMFIGVNNNGVGSLGEWAGAIFTGCAVLLALKDGRIILNAHFYFGPTDSILHQLGISRELRVAIENKSNFNVQIDGVSVLLFLSQFLRDIDSTISFYTK